MSSTYLKHALLKNPVKWLGQVPKRHDASLYLDGYYNSLAIGENPFVQALADTRMDVSRVRYPKENTVQIVVQKEPDENSYRLAPVLSKPTAGQHPALYLMNNRSYIRFLERKRVFLVPLKYRHRSPHMLGLIKPASKMDSQIEQLFRQRIEHLLREMESTAQEPYHGPNEMSVHPSVSENLVWKAGSVPILYTTLVQQELSLNYIAHRELIGLLLKYASFVSV